MNMRNVVQVLQRTVCIAVLVQMVDSIEKRDYQVIQAITLLIAMLNVFINLIIDLIYGLADPRIRLD